MVTYTYSDYIIPVGAIVIGLFLAHRISRQGVPTPSPADIQQDQLALSLGYVVIAVAPFVQRLLE